MQTAHDRLVTEIQRRADLLGLLIHYCEITVRCRGYRGLPDLIVAGGYGTVFLEVKTGGQDPGPAQVTWIHMLRAGGQDVHVIREADLEDGSLDDILARCAGRPADDQ